MEIKCNSPAQASESQSDLPASTPAKNVKMILYGLFYDALYPRS